MDSFFEQRFENLSFTSGQFKKGEYEDCIFVNCDFSGSDITESVFANCEFKGCNLSNLYLTRTAFRVVHFTDCKLMGLRFEYCNDFLFEVSFTRCNLDFSSFFQRKLKHTQFSHCSLQEVEFGEADLTGAKFEHCNLSRAVFDQSILEKADLRTAQNFIINPDTNRIYQAIFSLQGLPGLLSNYSIQIDDV
jgi:uncharacterized protein YjbI with pentapeptide repeats